MKTMFMIFASSLMWSSARAADLPVQRFQCGEQAYEAATITLDPNGYVPGSGFFRGTNAGLTYHYSGTQQMVCDGHRFGDIDCIGFWYDGRREVARLKLRQENGLLVALWTTSGLYGGLQMKNICKEIAENSRN